MGTGSRERRGNKSHGKWDKCRKTEEKVEMGVGFWMINGEMDCQFAERALALQSSNVYGYFPTRFTLPLPQIHGYPSQFWAWIVPRTTSYRGVEGIGICVNVVV